MPKNTKISIAQQDALVSLMETNRKLFTGKFDSSFTKKNKDDAWEDVSNNLNSMYGATKDTKNWIKTWADMKSLVKKKLQNLKKQLSKTGNNSDDEQEDPLTPLQQRIADLMGPIPSGGHLRSTESCVGPPDSEQIVLEILDLDMPAVDILLTSQDPSTALFMPVTTTLTPPHSEATEQQAATTSMQIKPRPVSNKDLDTPAVDDLHNGGLLASKDPSTALCTTPTAVLRHSTNNASSQMPKDDKTTPRSDGGEKEEATTSMRVKPKPMTGSLQKKSRNRNRLRVPAMNLRNTETATSGFLDVQKELLKVKKIKNQLLRRVALAQEGRTIAAAAQARAMKQLVILGRKTFNLLSKKYKE